jgi:hypothetical protein
VNEAARARETVATKAAFQRQLVFEGKQVDPEMWAMSHTERLARFRMTAPHVEYLVGHRQLNPREAATMQRRARLRLVRQSPWRIAAPHSHRAVWKIF